MELLPKSNSIWSFWSWTRLVFIFISLISSSTTATAKQPNVLVMLVDDLGWGDVSFHGTSQIPTPNIDLLASTGVILNNFYVSPICSPSRSALLTGYNPIHTGMQHRVIAVLTPYGLPLKYKTLGDRFRDLGYSTHIVGKWHQGHYARQYLPTSRGFDTFLGYLTSRSDYYNRMGGDLRHGYDFWENDQHANLTAYEGKYSTDLYTDRVVQLIQDHGKKNATKPFMIYFAQQSVHGGAFQQLPKRNIQPPLRHEAGFGHIKHTQRRRFAGMVAALDESVGRVFKALHQSGQLDDTIIYFSTDNGGASGNGRGGHIDDSQGSNWPLKGSKYTVWEGGVRGTAFLWSSKHLPKPYVSHQLMHITDVLPTLYAAAGGNLTTLGPIDGLNLWPALVNQSSGGHMVRDHVIHHIDHEGAPWRMWAIRSGQWKLTSGTWDHGNYDVWYHAPGQLAEHAAICYNCSDVHQVLAARGGAPAKPTIVTVDCKKTNQDHHTRTPCHAAQQTEAQYCMFDIEADPCETVNLAQTNATVAKKLYELYQQYNKRYTKPINVADDYEADPALHGGWIGPWK